MAICDRVRESRTEAGVFDLKGVRQELFADAFPFVPPRLWLFLVLSSPRAGDHVCYIRVVHGQTDKAICYAYARPRPRFSEAGGVAICRAAIRCAFPEAGWYTVQVWFFQQDGNDVLKGEVAFRVGA
jgi:hypothetical protein